MNKFISYTTLTFFTATYFAITSAQPSVFFGLTGAGGSYTNTLHSTIGAGTIFRFDPADDSESVVWNFGAPSDGALPAYGSLVYDSADGLYYSTTIYGGSYDQGTIFSFNPTTDSEKVVWNFGSAGDGRDPVRNISLATNGLYYGTTAAGGIYDTVNANGGAGSVFSFDPSTGTETMLWSFGSTNDGLAPYSDLVLNPGNGLYYGTTIEGGSHTNCPGGCGTIFSFNTDSNIEHVAWNFGSGNDGATPYGNLVYYADSGLFYGMTASIGSNPNCYNNCGTIFRFNPLTDSESVVWNFGTGTDGTVPFGNLVYDANNGLFYGMTDEGGSNPGPYNYGEGVIFTFDPGSNKEVVVWNFGGVNDGANPRGNLIFDASKNLFYGMTAGGGSKSSGTIFIFDPVANKDTILWNFGGETDGRSPNDNLSIYNAPSVITEIGKTANATSVNIYPNPANANLTVTGLNAGQTVELFNYLGQKLYGQRAENATLQLDISAQPDGMYLVMVINKDGSLACEKKLVKISLS